MTASSNSLLEAYVPSLAVSWLRDRPEDLWQEIEGSLAFVDISGFTALTERLARQGKIGAEQMSDILSEMFADLLSVAYRDGADLVKWGGDAVLLLFAGENHASRAARATHGMRERLVKIGKIGTGPKRVVLRMSVGIHSGTFHFFLVGDPAIHREFLISGPAASMCADMEALASADEIGLTAQTAALIDPKYVGAPLGDGFLLAEAPALANDTELPRPTSDTIDLGHLLPTAIRAHLLSSQGEAEHRKIGVAFVQFAGTDALLADEGPDSLAQALDECIRNVQHATERYGVTFFETDINRDGGKIMLTAGAPASGDRNDERILRATTEISANVGRLPTRIGVNRGEVFSGDFGPKFRRTYSVKGDAINLAARLLGKAAHGQVVATMNVLGKSDVEFEIDELEPFLVKGKSILIHAARVGRALEGTTHEVKHSAFVGREAEMAVLTEALTTAAAGDGRVVELSGEPGIGKSRLVSELLRDVDLPTLVTRCDEYEIATPYWPFQALLRAAMGVTDEADDPAVVSTLISLADEYDPELTPWLPLVANVLGVEMASTPEVDALADEFRKPRRDDTVAKLLGAILNSPTVLMIDDVHLMDESSMDLLERICHDLAERSWLILVTRRDVDRGFRPTDAYPVVVVRPQPLSSSSAVELIRRELADSAVTSHDIQLITTRAAGNPLFLRGLIQAARSGERVDKLPETVEALITSQIDQLPPDERTVLRFASVLGVAFQQNQLDSLLENRERESSHTFLERLSYFVRADGEGRYRFEHQLLRDTAYDGLPYRVRLQLHGHAAEIIEAAAAHPDDVAELLSLHYLHAKRPERAWHFALIGGARASEKFAHVEAEELYLRATQAARGLRGVSSADKAAAYVSLSDSQYALGRMDDALAALAKARTRLTDDPGALARVLLATSGIYAGLSDFNRAFKTAKAGIRAVNADIDSQSMATLSRLETTCAIVRLWQGRRSEARTWVTGAISHAAKTPDLLPRATANNTLLNISLADGKPDWAAGELALELFDELGDRGRQATVLNNLGMASWLEGNGADAVDRFKHANLIAVSSGDADGEAVTALSLGDVLMLMGRAVEAETQLRDCLPQLRALGFDDYVAYALRCLGMALVQQGQYDDGIAMIAEAARLQQLIAVDEELTDSTASLALAHLMNGDSAQARIIAEEAVRLGEGLEGDVALCKALRVLGAAEADTGDVETAQATLRRALSIAEANNAVELGFVLAELARVASQLNQSDEADKLNRESQLALNRLGFTANQRYSSN